MAGLGGGSSDAAAVLGFLDSFFGNYLGRNRLLSLSSRVGSDVPFFVSGYHGAFVTGRGEIIEECDTPHGKKLVLFIPEYGHSTVSAYNILDKIPRKERNLLCLSKFFPSRETHPNDFELVFPSPFSVDFQEKLEKEGILPLRKEGLREGRWGVIDYGDVVVHIFNEDSRLYYYLERLWDSGKNIERYAD